MLNKWYKTEWLLCIKILDTFSCLVKNISSVLYSHQNLHLKLSTAKSNNHSKSEVDRLISITLQLDLRGADPQILTWTRPGSNYDRGKGLFNENQAQFDTSWEVPGLWVILYWALQLVGAPCNGWIWKKAQIFDLSKQNVAGVKRIKFVGFFARIS